ncbi:nucleic acid-binding protein [Piscirickettsia litoralis]|uniref:Nucleic acid-binding protein n=2 Tax=Piscirickettsia litoralis TaxID=1891921 RepID=A0ABX3A5E2_9GAMM|nr:nucleic acid-binding protein [Piscirickettsia litoralis]
MRSRYTAYTQANIDYIVATMKGDALNKFDRNSATAWAKQSTWLNLQVLSASATHSNSQEGFVEFIASFQNQGKIECLSEKSRFVKEKGQWFYTDGQHN